MRGSKTRTFDVKNKTFKERYVEYKERAKRLNDLIKGSDGNRSYYLKTWFTMSATVIGGVVAVWQLPDILWDYKINNLLEAIFGGDIMFWNAFTLSVFLVICVIVILISRAASRNEIRKYLHKVVETERPGCRLELRVSDSYLTNAFVNYPKCAMVIGINKAFLFEEAESRSLIADMYEYLEKNYGIDKHDIQMDIDKAVAKLKEKFGDKIIDKTRPKVQVRCASSESGTQLRDNYKIGTMVGVDIRSKDPNRPLFKKLFLIANSEIVQGKDEYEPLVVTSDVKASVVENYYKIWDFFEPGEMGTLPPENKLCAPLLIPLIGGGVANEGYSDTEMFSTIVDMYFERLRESMRLNKKPAVASVIINIRNDTAIKGDKNTYKSRKIDLQNAFWYMDFRRKVRPVKPMKWEIAE